ncbi:hypothetical protein ASPZODRAFT_141756 [Penicilliopsis zonata CBS 506.65]|uniref:glucose oxidase n=1 Tax=Penicilliopsis zonata CBS 506.65 TaxID=1073090 RepID=A0A1L9SIP2_9EURO|nr:hypothetical protein ASPZODRAFT_141756 [Penicilliopsis zonata CBS 506.65]OJJ46986.1 hypothetical protein ASPZODRAFT_141756 [Penicilliopsis zonata CBS 506.65]
MLFLTQILLVLLAITVTATSQSYDYIVVGGGTSGLVLANRLSEDPGVSVLVVEAGSSVLNNVNVTDPNRYSMAFDTKLDWAYESVNQSFGGGPQVLRAGRALGGSSAINGMAYVRAQDVQVDAWEAIGNDGWTWETLFPYYLKSENFTIPAQTQVDAGATFESAEHGFQGPLRTAFPPMNATGELTPLINETLHALGIPWNRDINGGRMRGFSIYPWTLDGEIRHDAARAYYWPFANRANLHVLLDTRVNRILWAQPSNTTTDELTASGVEISLANTTSHIVAKKEVILSAGVLRSPALLELSGVGNPRILEAYGIPVMIDLPTVGENLQDQMNTLMTASGENIVTGGRTVTFATAQDIFGTTTASVAAALYAQLPAYAHQMATASHDAMPAEALLRLFHVQHDLIFKQNVPVAEIIFKPAGSDTTTINAGYWGLLPYARGSVHIASASPAANPSINPNYGLLPWDVQLQNAIARFIRSVFNTDPLRSFIKEETLPGLAAVPGNASDSVWTDWLKHNYASNFHPVGTTAMLPRSMGGVVNPHMKVYGTANVRVVDNSIHPFQLCGHPVSNLYAIAERAADLIKGDMKG